MSASGTGSAGVAANPNLAPLVDAIYQLGAPCRLPQAEVNKRLDDAYLKGGEHLNGKARDAKGHAPIVSQIKRQL